MVIPAWFWHAWWLLALAALYAPGLARAVSQAVGCLARRRTGQDIDDYLVYLYIQAGDTEGLRRYLDGR
jgi:hypothetical protein